MGITFGGVEMSVQLHLRPLSSPNMTAPAEVRPLATMRVNGAAAPIALAASVFGGREASRTEIALGNVQSGQQPTAPMVSPSI